MVSNTNKPAGGAGWLWWFALLVAAAAAAGIFIISQDPLNYQAREQINTIVLFASVTIGLCVISATAHWWVHR